MSFVAKFLSSTRKHLLLLYIFFKYFSFKCQTSRFNLTSNLDSPKLIVFRFYFLSALDDLRNHLENADNLVEMKFLLLEQKYLEHLSRGNSIDALKVSCHFIVQYCVMENIENDFLKFWIITQHKFCFYTFFWIRRLEY